MAKYKVHKHALPDGTLDENYRFLFEEVNKSKTRYIREHLEILRAFAKSCNHITEMGVDGVNSTWAFLVTKPKRLVSIDMRNTKAPEILELAAKLAEENGIEFEFIESNTLEIEIEKTDMLFIDTDHSYKQLSTELKLHAPKVRKYIAMHDTSAFIGLLSAIQDFMDESNNEWQIIYETYKSCGLTIIERV